MATPTGESRRRSARRPRPRARRFRLLLPRLVAVARVTAVVALVPLLFAGLAVAGVSLPEPARNAFEAVGVDSPQPAR